VLTFLLRARGTGSVAVVNASRFTNIEGNMTTKFSLSSIAIKVSGRAAIAILMASLFGPVGTAQSAEVRHEEGEQLKPTGKGWGELDPSGLTAAHAARPNSNGNGIFYHGGPVMLTVNIYYIWYGNWSGNTATNILADFAGSLGSSPYFDINTTYTDGTGHSISGQVIHTGSTNDNYSHGTNLGDADVQAIVGDALASPSLNHGYPDLNGVYFVLTSADVNETSGFCTRYCAWHTHGTINGNDIKYAFVGNPDRCPSACAAQTTSPNDNAGADGMANMIAHELSEAVTDPDLNAWYDRRGLENGDKCNWNFGHTTTASNGSQYNVTLGVRNYLLQQIWANKNGGYCAISYP
jgi:hypothetical protein